jgi:hypothetical protein
MVIGSPRIESLLLSGAWLRRFAHMTIVERCQYLSK